MRLFFFIAVLLLSGFSADAMAHEHETVDHHAADQQQIVAEVKAVKIKENLYMLQAGGGNMGLWVGEDSALVIDNDVPGMGSAVMKAIKGLTDRPVRLLVNTHWHFDHAGNNREFREAGTVIMAHDNVRKRLDVGQDIPALGKTVEPAHPHALPLLTYDQGTHVHLNGTKAQVISVPAAHTDGDSIIYWPDLNVLHTGDVFFNGFYPFIDVSSGGSIEGMVAVTAKLLDMVDENTVIIPGHGPLANKGDLQNYYSFIKTAGQRANKAKLEGKSLELWLAEQPLSDFEKDWGDGFLNTEAFLTIVWSSL